MDRADVAHRDSCLCRVTHGRIGCRCGVRRTCHTGWPALWMPLLQRGAVSVGSPADPATAARSSTASWQAVAIAIYLGGVVLLLLHMVAGRFRWHVWCGARSEVSDPAWRRLLAESSAASPSTSRFACCAAASRRCRWRSASIRVPSLTAIADTWSEDRRRAVLLHELAHVGQTGLPVASIAALACAFYWVHPGIVVDGAASSHRARAGLRRPRDRRRRHRSRLRRSLARSRVFPRRASCSGAGRDHGASESARGPHARDSRRAAQSCDSRAATPSRRDRYCGRTDRAACEC